MRTLVFFLEEPSAREMLEGVLPRLLPNEIQVRYHVFQGKQDLEKNLLRKLRGWTTVNSFFVIMRDQDLGDCKAIKAKLVELCSLAGHTNLLVRIACKELESFYLGDLNAVEQALNIKGIKKLQQKRKYKDPDSLSYPSNELSTLTGNKYQKISGSRAISPLLNIQQNQSKSFNVLISGILNLIVPPLEAP